MYLYVENLQIKSLDVKKSSVKICPVTGDSIDRFLERLQVLPCDVEIDFEVEAIVNRISSIGKGLDRALAETLAEYGLTRPEYQVLTQLRLAPPPHRSSPGKLAQRLELSSGAMTTRLDHLEEAGLVRRLPDPDDRRGVLVELTEQGLAAWDDAASVQGRKEAFFASALTQDQRAQLNDLLRTLMLALEAREAAR